MNNEKPTSTEFLDSLVTLSPTELEMFLAVIPDLPPSQQLEMKESLESTPAGRAASLLAEMEEYHKNPQMNEILQTFLRICKPGQVDLELIADVLEVLRSEYLQFHAPGSTGEVSLTAQLLYGSPKIDDAFRLLAENYIRMIMKCSQEVA
jgi:hypothetical protein